MDMPSRPHAHEQPSLSQPHSFPTTKSNTKFIIRYEQKQFPLPLHKINRYSTKHQHQLIRNKKISESVLQKIKQKNANTNANVPSYLRPTQASISAQLERNRVASVAEIAHGNKMVGKIRSKSLEEEEEDGEKEYNRVPIQFYDEKNYGCGADFNRARVVYRGYAPKNTYYYLKTLKPFKRKPKKPIHQSSQTSPTQQPDDHQKPQSSTQLPSSLSSMSSLSSIKSQLDLKFDSKFESGNLSAVSRISQYQYWLYIREDTNTHGLRQWYYFTIANKKIMKVRLRVYKFSKSYSLYRIGMRPYVRVGGEEFQQAGGKVKYQYDNMQKCYYLEFQYKFQEDNMEVEFAMLPPYTYSMLRQYLRTLQNMHQPQKQDPQQQPQPPKSQRQPTPSHPSTPSIQILPIGQSLSGLDIPLLKISKPIDKNQYQQKMRQCIIILARTHPGQTVSNFTLQSFINYVLDNVSIFEYFDFFIVPMVNPDGVYFGNHRTSVIGQDLNRNFNVTDFQVFPEIQAVHSAINLAKRTHKIRYLLDLHGHSARKNIFAYGPQHQLSTPAYLHTRILPKLLNDTISSFKYSYCIFRQSKQKKNTARVHFTNKYKIHCLTFQQSYGIVEDGPMGVQNWKNFGIALAECLLQVARMYKQGKERAFQNYLSEQIEKQKVMLQKLYQKHRKMLGITTMPIQPDNQQQNKKNKTQTNITLDPQNTNPNKNRNKSQLTQKHHKQEHSKISSQVNDKQQQQQGRERENYNENDKQKYINEIQEEVQKQEEEEEEQGISIASSELSSGDQSLELNNQQIQVIRKDILKIGCFKEGAKRQKYNIADKKLQLFDSREPQDTYPSSHRDTNSKQQIVPFRRLHEQKSSMIPRIAKLQQKRKQQYNLSFKRQVREERRDIIEKQKLERRKQIEAKFKKMELPSIKK